MLNLMTLWSPGLTQLAVNPLYLDPGSGSIIIQVLLAALLGGAYIIRVYWNKIKQIFKRTQPSTPEVEENKSDEG